MNETDDRTWLTRMDAMAWVRAGLAEVSKAQGQSDPRAVIAACKRAAGMGLNGYLVVDFRESWGRSYVEHLRAAAEDEAVPEAVRVLCKRIVEAEPPGHALVQLRSKGREDALVDATKDVLAWVYGALLKRGESP